MFHGGASSRGRHRLRGLKDRSNPSNPGNRNLSRRNNPGNLSSPSDLNDLSRRSDYSISELVYSSEASSFIPSSIRDLSRNEKLSLIVLRWLPSG